MHDETVKYNTIGHSTLITTSAWKNDQGASTGGILLNKRSINSLCEVISHSERILISTFHGNPATSIIIIYSPTNSSEDEVRRAIETIPQHNVLIIIGDFNARIGKDDGNFTYHQETNKNGVLLIDIINEKQLVITNTSFQNKLNKLWTYMDPCCRKYQLDYILMRKKWRNSITNVEAYSNFSSIGSDHRIVSYKVRLSLRANRKTLPRKLRYNWPLFKSDMSLQEK